MKKRQEKDGSDVGATSAVIGALLMFLCLPLVFGAFGEFQRTATPPLIALTINEAGCEYVSSSGIAIESHEHLCQIKVRYRENVLDDGGVIELPHGGSLRLGGGLVVGSSQLDDGSDMPWTTDHKRAATLLGAAIGAIVLILAGMAWFPSRRMRHGR